MAEKNGKEIGQDREKITEGRSGSNRSTEATNTDTAGTGTDRNSGTAGTGTAGTGKAKAKEKKPVEVAVLIPDQEEKPKKKRTQKKKKEEPKQADDITKLLVTVSTMVASRPDQAHWLITEAEAKSIAEPLSNIIEKSEVFSKLAEHSDSIALATACATVFLPRGFMSYMQYKEKEKEKKKNVKQKPATRTGNKDGKSRSGNGQPSERNDRIATADVPYVDSPLYATAEAIV